MKYGPLSEFCNQHKNPIIKVDVGKFCFLYFLTKKYEVEIKNKTKKYLHSFMYARIAR
jgi:hypothetical protein